MIRRLGLAVAAGMVVAAWAFAQSGARQDGTATPAAKSGTAGPAKSSAPKEAKKPAGDKAAALVGRRAGVEARGHGRQQPLPRLPRELFQGRARRDARPGRDRLRQVPRHFRRPHRRRVWTSGGKGTPPDKMFLPDKVNPFCGTCHKLGTSGDSKCPFPAQKDEKRCTECHGKHHLAQRKCKWK